ncbi:MAG TPA: hypothetical protein DD640_06280 [Clostridiales bacterium]|nr:hypothetical protein [Clostridiales bacterium]
MKQLKMYWRRQPVEEFSLPEGFSVTQYRFPEDKERFADIWLDGKPEQDPDVFDKSITNYPDAVAERDVFFIVRGEEYVATITAIYHPAENKGYIHMVAAKTKVRGLGIGNFMNSLALKRLCEYPCEYVYLTTDDFRKPAIKSYLRAGFLPVDYDEDMPARWQALIEEFGIPQVEMLHDDTSYSRTLVAGKPV